MPFDKGENQRWSDLCDQHEAAKKEVDAAFRVVQEKYLGIGDGSGSTNPTAEDMARLEDTRAKCQAIERLMDGFMTTRR